MKMNAEETRRILKALDALRNVTEAGFARLDSMERTLDRMTRPMDAAIERLECR
jgi:ribosomal 50S subunit-associated protein YjgA (DUF615 family)